jgi:hypothetical protein
MFQVLLKGLFLVIAAEILAGCQSSIVATPTPSPVVMIHPSEATTQPGSISTEITPTHLPSTPTDMPIPTADAPEAEIIGIEVSSPQSLVGHKGNVSSLVFSAGLMGMLNMNTSL